MRCRFGTSALLMSVAVLVLVPSSCADPGDPGDTEFPEVHRHAAIPADAVKGTPANDEHPPILHSDEFHAPVSLPVISTAGAEDAPFIPAGSDDLYFFFAADVRQDPSLQIRDPVNGIWWSRRIRGEWREPTLVWLQAPGTLALNGCPFVDASQMLFCSAREGYAGVGWFRARPWGPPGQEWSYVDPVDFPAGHQVGELHIHRDTLWFDSPRPGGKGGHDIWMAARSAGVWGDPVNVAAVNTAADESRPFLTADGSEFWFTRTYQGTPSVWRSRRGAGGWESPEIIVSSFAGEPTLDSEGNLYFVHHYFVGGVMREADIYVAMRR